MWRWWPVTVGSAIIKYLYPEIKEKPSVLPTMEAASSNNNNKRKIDLLLECDLCHGHLVDNQPKSLPCLHTFCAPCLTNNGGQHFIKDSNILCPVCHTVVSRSSEESGIIDSLELDVIIGKLLRLRHLQHGGRHCGMCRPEDEVVSTKWCPDCEKFLCDSCLVHHGRYKPKDKVIDLPQEGTNDSLNVSDFISPTKCSRHEKKFKMYCTKCEVCLCSTCSMEHNSEKKDNSEPCSPVSIGVDGALGTKAQEGLNLLDEMYSRLEKEQRQIEDMKLEISDLEKQYQNKRADVLENVEETIRKLKENACAFVAEMEAVTKSEIDELQKSILLKQDLVKEMEITDVTFFQLLQSFDNVDILLNYPRLETKCKNLLVQPNGSASHIVNMEYNEWYLNYHEQSENVPLARCWKDLKLPEGASSSSSSSSSSFSSFSSEVSRLETKTLSWLTYLRNVTTHPLLRRTKKLN